MDNTMVNYFGHSVFNLLKTLWMLWLGWTATAKAELTYLMTTVRYVVVIIVGLPHLMMMLLLLYNLLLHCFVSSINRNSRAHQLVGAHSNKHSTAHRAGTMLHAGVLKL